VKLKQPAIILAFSLFALTILIVIYRVVWLKYPILPTMPGQVWQISFEAKILPDEREIIVAVALPTEHTGRVIVEERITSDTLSFNLFQEGMNRIGLWSGTSEGEAAVITYKSSLILRPRRFPSSQNPTIASNMPAITREESDFVERLGTKWKTLDPQQRLKAIASVVGGIQEINNLISEDLDAWNKLENIHGRVGALLILLNAAGLPANTVSGLLLERGIQTSPAVWIETWDGKRWQAINPQTGQTYNDPSILLALSTAKTPVVSVTKGRIQDMSWSLERQIMSKWRLHFERIKRSQRLLDRWSFFSIPEEFQNLFRVLLLVPLGALMICVLRNVIGFPTFGIFMPVLLALAFRSTGLMYGVGIFTSVVLIGYIARRAIDRFRLLLVPRLSVLLTLVIICFGIFALIGGKLRLQALMGVGLLPIVILTMSIERFFVLIEESGTREALNTAAGTVAVSIITFFIIQLELLQLIFFIYPELLFAVAGVQILLGRYTGYRLSELIRFRVLARKNK